MVRNKADRIKCGACDGSGRQWIGPRIDNCQWCGGDGWSLGSKEVLSRLIDKASDGNIPSLLWLAKTPEEDRLFEVRRFLYDRKFRSV